MLSRVPSSLLGIFQSGYPQRNYDDPLVTMHIRTPRKIAMDVLLHYGWHYTTMRRLNGVDQSRVQYSQTTSIGGLNEDRHHARVVPSNSFGLKIEASTLAQQPPSLRRPHSANLLRKCIPCSGFSCHGTR